MVRPITKGSNVLLWVPSQDLRTELTASEHMLCPTCDCHVAVISGYASATQAVAKSLDALLFVARWHRETELPARTLPSPYITTKIWQEMSIASATRGTSKYLIGILGFLHEPLNLELNVYELVQCPHVAAVSP